MIHRWVVNCFQRKWQTILLKPGVHWNDTDDNDGDDGDGDDDDDDNISINVITHVIVQYGIGIVVKLYTVVRVER